MGTNAMFRVNLSLYLSIYLFIQFFHMIVLRLFVVFNFIYIVFLKSHFVIMSVFLLFNFFTKKNLSRRCEARKTPINTSLPTKYSTKHFLNLSSLYYFILWSTKKNMFCSHSSQKFAP